MGATKMKRVMLSSILAGIMVAIGTIVYLNSQSMLGAFLFTIGLLTILYFKLDLFTGKVPYMKNYKELPYILMVLVGNVIGCCILFAFPNPLAIQHLELQLTVHPLVILIKSMLCNALIYIAVEVYKHNDIITVILSVATFIVAGFDHSIARICLIIAARVFNIDVLLYIIIVIVGNALGGILFHRIRGVINNEVC